MEKFLKNREKIIEKWGKINESILLCKFEPLSRNPGSAPDVKTDGWENIYNFRLKFSKCVTLYYLTSPAVLFVSGQGTIRSSRQ